jgi:hypothetical protein
VIYVKVKIKVRLGRVSVMMTVRTSLSTVPFL